MSKEQFVDLEKTKVEILKEKAEIGISEFKEDSSKNWVEIRFEKPLLVKMLSLIEQAERVQELEEKHKEYVSFTESNNYNMDVEFEKLYKQNKRYREAIKNIKLTQKHADDVYDHVGKIYEIIKALEGEE